MSTINTLREYLAPVRPDPNEIKPCPLCGRRHTMDEPHDWTSPRYKRTFYKHHRRPPTYDDATAHMNNEDVERLNKIIRERNERRRAHA